MNDLHKNELPIGKGRHQSSIIPTNLPDHLEVDEIDEQAQQLRLGRSALDLVSCARRNPSWQFSIETLTARQGWLINVRQKIQ